MKIVKKITIIINFLAHFLLFFYFSLLDPDPVGKMNADLCGSGSTALVIIRDSASEGVGDDQALELHFTFLPFPHRKQRLFENCLKEKVFRSSYRYLFSQTQETHFS